MLLTDLVEQAVGESLLPACRSSVREPHRGGRRRARPRRGPVGAGGASDVTGAYRQAAAVSALEARRRAIARLRGLGATVVDARPGRLPPRRRLADTYRL